MGVSSKFGAIVAVKCGLSTSEFYDDGRSNLQRTPRLCSSIRTRPHADATSQTRLPFCGNIINQRSCFPDMLAARRVSDR